MKTKINAAYIRVSTENQSPESQLQAIRQFLQLKGITDYKIYQDIGESGSKESRPSFNELLNDIKQGKVETLVIYKLDRLFRSLSHLLSYLKLFSEYQVKFSSVQESIDLTTPQGVLMAQLLGAFAEFERSLIIERTKAGLRATKVNGQKLGAPIKITLETRTKVLELRTQGFSYNEIAKQCNISNSMAHQIVKSNSVI